MRNTIKKDYILKDLNFNKNELKELIEKIHVVDHYYQIVITDNFLNYINTLENTKCYKYFNLFSNYQLIIDTLKELKEDYYNNLNK